MASELINIAIYTYTGVSDSSLTPTIDIYNITDAVSSVTGGIMLYSASTKTYQYTFSSYDTIKEYYANVDCGVGALTRYLSFGIGDASALHHGDKILNVDEELSIIL